MINHIRCNTYATFNLALSTMFFGLIMLCLASSDGGGLTANDQLDSDSPIPGPPPPKDIDEEEVLCPFRYPPLPFCWPMERNEPWIMNSTFKYHLI